MGGGGAATRPPLGPRSVHSWPHTFIHALPFHIFPVPVALAVAKPGWPLGHVVGHQGAPTSPTHLALVRQKSDAGTAQPPWKVEAPGHWRTRVLGR